METMEFSMGSSGRKAETSERDSPRRILIPYGRIYTDDTYERLVYVKGRRRDAQVKRATLDSPVRNPPRGFGALPLSPLPLSRDTSDVTSEIFERYERETKREFMAPRGQVHSRQGRAFARILTGVPPSTLRAPSDLRAHGACASPPWRYLIPFGVPSKDNTETRSVARSATLSGQKGARDGPSSWILLSTVCEGYSRTGRVLPKSLRPFLRQKGEIHRPSSWVLPLTVCLSYFFGPARSY